MQNDNIELKDNGSLWSTFSEEEARGFLQGADLGVNHPARIFVRDLVKKLGGGTLLDVPTGSGVDAEVLKDVCSYTGMDKTTVLLKTVAERYKVPTILGDIRKMPIEDNSFDIVLARAIFEHLTGIEDTEMAIKECVRVSKRDTIIAFYLPLQDRTQVNWNGMFFENRYSESGIIAILESIGLPYERHFVDVSGTNYVDSYTIFHIKKAKTSKKAVADETTKEVTEEFAKEVAKEEKPKRTRKKKEV